jgi:hypothetical protein
MPEYPVGAVLSAIGKRRTAVLWNCCETISRLAGIRHKADGFAYVPNVRE